MSFALSRRALLQAAAASAIVGGAAKTSQALGRRPYQGQVRFALPWPTRKLDPHSLSDPTAAFFAPSVADSLFALDTRGHPYPTLAEELPQETADGFVIHLRPGVVTSDGTPLSNADVVASLQRSKTRGGVAWLHGIQVQAGKDPLAIHFHASTADHLATRLASPIAAILPRGYSPSRPNATGAFEMRGRTGQLFLSRNIHAARGPAFVDGIEVWRGDSLQDCLRAFEVGDSDVGWLGGYLHRPRPGARAFDAGSVGWVTLRTGQHAGVGPGAAQAIVDGLDPRGLAHFGLGSLPAQRGVRGWYGEPCELLVRDDAPYLTQLASAIADLLSRPGHKIEMSRVSPAEISRRRRDRRFAMMLDTVRKLGPGDLAMIVSLLSAVDVKLARRPPMMRDAKPRQILRTHSMGVVGELRVAGAYAPRLHGIQNWNLGSMWQH